MNEHHARLEYGSSSEPEPEYPAVKTEVAVPSKADPAGSFLPEAVAAERATPVGDGSCAGGPDGAVKTEVRISFPSKRVAAGGE